MSRSPYDSGSLSLATLPIKVGGVSHANKRRRRTVNGFNKLMIGLQRVGIGLGRAQVLTTTGRRTGQPRKTPVGVVPIGGQTYIFQAYPNAAWVANVRATPTATLADGRRLSTVRLVEVPVEERRHLLLEQLRNESRRTGRLLVKSGLVADPSPEAVAASAERIAVFRVEMDGA